MWLQGGPGVTSLFGLFNEIGPYQTRPDGGSLQLHPNGWNSFCHLLFLDQPVGSGFSFTSNPNGFETSDHGAARQIIIALTQFFGMFALNNNTFYIAGESYSGKTIPTVINLAPYYRGINFNIAGAIIVSGFVDPVVQSDYSNVLFNYGLVNVQEQMVFRQFSEAIKQDIENQRFVEAGIKYSVVIKPGLFPSSTLYYNLTGSSNPYNFLLTEEPHEWSTYEKYILRPDVMRALHVNPNRKIELFSQMVDHCMLNTLMRSAKNDLEITLNSTRILMMYGTNDVICSAALGEQVIESLNWKYATRFQDKSKTAYYQNEHVVAYERKYGNLCHVVVRNASHMITYDQPLVALIAVKNFIFGRQ